MSLVSEILTSLSKELGEQRVIMAVESWLLKKQIDSSANRIWDDCSGEDLETFIQKNAIYPPAWRTPERPISPITVPSAPEQIRMRPVPFVERLNIKKMDDLS